MKKDEAQELLDQTMQELDLAREILRMLTPLPADAQFRVLAAVNALLQGAPLPTRLPPAQPLGIEAVPIYSAPFTPHGNPRYMAPGCGGGKGK